jgi:small subunit ribosomal protein S1
MTTVANDTFEKFIKSSEDIIPVVGQIISAEIIEIAKREIHFNIPGFRTGIVRGYELARDPQFVSNLKVGDKVNVRVLELDNENGEVELAFAESTENRLWDKFKEIQEKNEIVEVTISDVNKGGLIIFLDGVAGFMPVSQLRPENYPRVSGGDRGKILDKLRAFVGKKMKVKIITASPEDNKLIFSEKAVWEEEFKDEIKKYKVGEEIEGKISALADFGAFIKFDSLEGLIHISEISWQKIEHPSDVLKVGETIKAKILEISGSKIFLSVKRLTEDPWKDINAKFKVGDMVKGRVAKINPFGFIVELTPEIFGLAHISELASKNVDPFKVAKVGDELDFKIVSIEPEYHKLGLSLKALEESSPVKTSEDKEPSVETSEGERPVTPKSDESEKKE